MYNMAAATLWKLEKLQEEDHGGRGKKLKTKLQWLGN